MKDNIIKGKSAGKRKEKIILVYPRLGIELTEAGGAIGLPYSILTVAAELKQKYEVIILDQRTEENWKARIRKEIEGCLFLGISSMTGTQLKNALEIAKFVRTTDDSVPIVWGGVHVSTLPEQSLKDRLVDIVVRGEGEKTAIELADALKNNKPLDGILGVSFKKGGRIISNPPRPLMDLEEIKPIPWELIKAERYFMKGQLTKDTKRELDLGETSRGCPYACTFCYNSTKTHFTWRAMSPEKTVRVIKDAIDRFGIDGFWLRDDNFFVDFKRVEKVLDLMKKEGINIPWYCPGIRLETINRMPEKLFRKLISSNIKRFRPGVESGNARVLKLINKGVTPEGIISANLRLKKSGILVEYSYIIGFPTETLQEMYDTVDMVLKLKKDNPNSISHNINLFTPYPGTKLYETAVSMGFKEPKTMDEWGEFHHLNINFNDYNKKQQDIMKNMSEISYYTAGFVYENLSLPYRVLSYPLRRWSEFRLNNKMFTFRLDMEIVRIVRKFLMKI